MEGWERKRKGTECGQSDSSSSSASPVGLSLFGAGETQMDRWIDRYIDRWVDTCIHGWISAPSGLLSVLLEEFADSKHT